MATADSPTTVGRRTALKLIAGAAALPVLACATEEATEPPPEPRPPSDPDLVNPVVPWDPVLTAAELVTVAALCDIIIPADDRSPSASQVGVPDYIDEWVSAPYDGNRRDQILVRGGLIWLNTEAAERFQADFADLTLEQKHAICDDIHYLPDSTPEFRSAALFFDKMRDLTGTAFYTTEEGMVDLGYMGNVPLATFDGPPEEVVRALGIEELVD